MKREMKGQEIAPGPPRQAVGVLLAVLALLVAMPEARAQGAGEAAKSSGLLTAGLVASVTLASASAALAITGGYRIGESRSSAEVGAGIITGVLSMVTGALDLGLSLKRGARHKPYTGIAAIVAGALCLSFSLAGAAGGTSGVGLAPTGTPVAFGKTSAMVIGLPAVRF